MTSTPADFDLQRFIDAQANSYEQALAEVRSGRKRSHWMWFIFPQLEGLGSSATAQRYAIRSLNEARAYLSHPLLGPRLIACSEAALTHGDRSAHDIFGPPDDLKFRSCATLFAQVAPAGSVFHRVIDQFFGGRFDANTLRLLGV